jgi:hypothetical protein
MFGLCSHNVCSYYMSIVCLLCVYYVLAVSVFARFFLCCVPAMFFITMIFWCLPCMCFLCFVICVLFVVIACWPRAYKIFVPSGTRVILFVIVCLLCCLCVFPVSLQCYSRLPCMFLLCMFLECSFYLSIMQLTMSLCARSC